jgi:hypothetical protein
MLNSKMNRRGEYAANKGRGSLDPSRYACALVVIWIGLATDFGVAKGEKKQECTHL